MIEIERSSFGKNNLINEWSLTPYLRYGCAFGLFIQDSMKGFVIFLRSWDNPGSAYLMQIAIEEKSQGKGNGYYLLLQSLLNLKKNGLSIVGLTVDPNNLRARHLYCNRFGFEVAEHRKDEYGQGYDRLFLQLDLKNWNPEKL